MLGSVLQGILATGSHLSLGLCRSVVCGEHPPRLNPPVFGCPSPILLPPLPQTFRSVCVLATTQVLHTRCLTEGPTSPYLLTSEQLPDPAMPTQFLLCQVAEACPPSRATSPRGHPLALVLLFPFALVYEASLSVYHMPSTVLERTGCFIFL